MKPSGSPHQDVQVHRPERYAPARDEADMQTTSTVIPMLVKSADDLVPVSDAETAKDQANPSYGGAVEAEIIDLDDWRRFTLPPDMEP